MGFLNTDRVTEEEYVGNIEGFFRQNPWFPLPFVCLAVVVHGLTWVPQLAEFFRERDMQPWGLLAAGQLCIFSILCGFAIHGFICVYHDTLCKMGLKIQKDNEYECGNEVAAVRSSLVNASQLVYAVLPIRMGPSTFWQFVVGVVILNILQDIWFFVAHYAFHLPLFYKRFHKCHHTWKQPTAFAAYYITSYTHMIQEHLITIPVVMFLPVPLSSWLFYQYMGTPGAMIQHCGFDLSRLKMPFCGPLKFGHILTLLNPLTLILGGQTIAMHDYHHETFQGNFALTYKYLDMLFGTYIDPSKAEKRADISAPLV